MNSNLIEILHFMTVLHEILAILFEIKYNNEFGTHLVHVIIINTLTNDQRFLTIFLIQYLNLIFWKLLSKVIQCQIENLSL